MTWWEIGPGDLLFEQDQDLDARYCYGVIGNMPYLVFCCYLPFCAGWSTFVTAKLAQQIVYFNLSFMGRMRIGTREKLARKKMFLHSFVHIKNWAEVKITKSVTMAKCFQNFEQPLGHRNTAGRYTRAGSRLSIARLLRPASCISTPGRGPVSTLAASKS